MNFTLSDKYGLNIRDEIYFEIIGGFNKDKDGNITVENNGATFILNKVDSNYLILTYLWE